MNKLFDKNVIAQTSWDSSILNGLTAIVHQFATAGEHRVTMMKGGKQVNEFPIQVKAQPTPTPKIAAAAAAAEPVEEAPHQLDIDLTLLEKPAAGMGLLAAKPADQLTAAAGGFVLFHAMGEPEGFSLVSRIMAGGVLKEIFNSEKLIKGDYYTVNLVRPGKYSMTNLLTKAQGKLTMTYPVVGDKPYQPPDPVRIHCTARGFEPADVTLQPFQGIVFEFDVPSRIKVDLVEPIEKPKGA